MTLRDAARVRQLFKTISVPPAQPARSANGECAGMAGTHYTLTFLQGATPLQTVRADSGGCRTVTIVGAPPVREGTKDFWQQLDQAIMNVMPPLHPDRMAIAVTTPAGQTLLAPQSAQIVSATTTQLLYDAILALPLANSGGARCPYVDTPTYQFVFFAGEQLAPACVYDTDQTVEIDGGSVWGGGVHTMNHQFRSLLRSILAGADFAPARPDQFALTMTKGHTIAQAPVRDTQLLLAVYTRILTLRASSQPGQPQPGCHLDADKVAGAGTWTRFTFTPWNLVLVRIDTYEGSCRFIQESDTGQALLADQAFWDLVHRALMG
jgi:hypothetical protein